MNQSESISLLAEALAKAQKLIKGADLDAVNPHFKSKYATLTSVKRASAEALAANGLVVVQALETDGVSNFLETRLLHVSGEWISGRMMLVVEKNTMQGMGSAITYAKRYSLAAITGVVDEDDDDGNEATTHAPKPQAPQYAPYVATTGAGVGASPSNAGEPSIPVGKSKLSGTPLSRLTPDQMRDTLGWWEASLAKDGKTIDMAPPAWKPILLAIRDKLDGPGPKDGLPY